MVEQTEWQSMVGLALKSMRELFLSRRLGRFFNLSISFYSFKHFQNAPNPASFCARIFVHHSIEHLENFPQMEVNSIGEKLLMEHHPFDDLTCLIIRRLPMECTDSEDEMWEKNSESIINLPSINL